LARRFSEAYDQMLEEGGSIAAPFLALWSAASFSGMPTCPGTQQTRTEPLSVYGNLSHVSQVEAIVRKDSKTSCDEPANGDRSRVATSRLSKNTQRLVAKRAVCSSKAALIPANAALASASKTSLFRPRAVEN
jgi:hypothetical protein